MVQIDVSKLLFSIPATEAAKPSTRGDAAAPTFEDHLRSAEQPKPRGQTASRASDQQPMTDKNQDATSTPDKPVSPASHAPVGSKEAPADMKESAPSSNDKTDNKTDDGKLQDAQAAKTSDNSQAAAAAASAAVQQSRPPQSANLKPQTSADLAADHAQAEKREAPVEPATAGSRTAAPTKSAKSTAPRAGTSQSAAGGPPRPLPNQPVEQESPIPSTDARQEDDANIAARKAAANQAVDAAEKATTTLKTADAVPHGSTGGETPQPRPQRQSVGSPSPISKVSNQTTIGSSHATDTPAASTTANAPPVVNAAPLAPPVVSAPIAAPLPVGAAPTNGAPSTQTTTSVTTENEPPGGSTNLAGAGRRVGKQDDKADGLSQAERVRLVQRVSRALTTVGSSGGQLRLRLSPPELGSVKLDVKVEDGRMSARVETESDTARSLLVDNLPQLRERLSEQGITIERFDVDLMNQSSGGSPENFGSRERGGQQQAGEAVGAMARPVNDSEPTERAVRRGRSATGALDVLV